MPDRPYIFLDLTISLCNECLRRVEAKVIIENDQVFLLKYCPEHKRQKVLISTDPEYYKKAASSLSPGRCPNNSTRLSNGAAPMIAACVPITNSTAA